MLIKNNGLKTDYFYLQPFELNKGEIVVINIQGGGYFYETEMYLKNIFSGNLVNKEIFVNQKLLYVEHFIEPKIRHLFYPMRVGEYIRKNANLQSHFATKIYETPQIIKRTKINSLVAYHKNLLSLYTSLSKTNNIIFDLVGHDPHSSYAIYDIVKENVKKTGSAILLDNCNDMKNNCTTYIELEWDLEKTQTIKPTEFKLNT